MKQCQKVKLERSLVWVNNLAVSTKPSNKQKVFYIWERKEKLEVREERRISDAASLLFGGITKNMLSPLKTEVLSPLQKQV